MKQLPIKSLFFRGFLLLLAIIGCQLWANPCKNWLTPVGQEISSKAAAELFDLGYIPLEGVGDERWGIDGPMHAKRNYEVSLAGILRKTGVFISRGFFERLITKFKAQGGRADVLDLFGSGFFVRYRFLTDSITGLRWGPYNQRTNPNELEYWFDRAPPPQVFGDIFNPKTWAKLDQSMKERGIPSQNLVVMRPVAGWHGEWTKTPKMEAAAMKFIIGNVLSRLSANGRFYFTIGNRSSVEELLQLLEPVVKEIEAKTSFRLVLHNYGEFQGRRVKLLTGSILPK